MRFPILSKIAVAVHLAFIFGYLAFVHPGPEDIMAYLPLVFLAAGLFETTLLFPSAHKGEDVDDARGRTWHAMLRDPVFQIGAAVFVFILFQTLNGPRELFWDRPSKSWKYTQGIIWNFPACVDQLLSIEGAIAVLTIGAALVAVRHGMGKNGRNLLTAFMLGISTVLGLYGLFNYVSPDTIDSAKPLAGFATVSEAGAFFFMNACAAFGAFFTEMSEEEPQKYLVRYLLLALLVNIAAALYSLSPLFIALLALVLIVLAVYTAVFFVKESPGELSLTTLATLIILASAVGFLHYVAYPENRIHDCTERIFSGPWVFEEVKAEKDVMNAAAWRMFDDNVFGGVGTWCYGLPESGMARYVHDDEWKALPDPETPRWRCGNDLAQFMAEFGVFGTALLVSPFLFMGVMSLIALNKAWRHGTKRKPGRNATTAADGDKVGVFDVMPPRTLSLFLPVVAVSAASFFTSVFRSLPNVLTWVVFLAMAQSQIPKSPSKH